MVLSHTSADSLVVENIATMENIVAVEEELIEEIDSMVVDSTVVEEVDTILVEKTRRL